MCAPRGRLRAVLHWVRMGPRPLTRPGPRCLPAPRSRPPWRCRGRCPRVQVQALRAAQVWGQATVRGTVVVLQAVPWAWAVALAAVARGRALPKVQPLRCVLLLPPFLDHRPWWLLRLPWVCPPRPGPLLQILGRFHPPRLRPMWQQQQQLPCPHPPPLLRCLECWRVLPSPLQSPASHTDLVLVVSLVVTLSAHHLPCGVRWLALPSHLQRQGAVLGPA